MTRPLLKLPSSAVVACLLAFGLAAPALAGHYYLSDVPELVDEAQVAALAAREIMTTEDLLEHTASRRGRARLGRALSLPATTMLSWARFCDLLRIDGIGPRVVRLLQAAGVADVAQLARLDPAKDIERLEATNKEHQLIHVMPGQEQIEEWVVAARRLPVIVK